jgi:hypothetical protein
MTQFRQSVSWSKAITKHIEKTDFTKRSDQVNGVSINSNSVGYTGLVVGQRQVAHLLRIPAKV